MRRAIRLCVLWKNAPLVGAFFVPEEISMHEKVSAADCGRYKSINKERESMDRYSIIEEKNKREIVLLRGRGCIYRKCPFCDYHSDSSPNDEENFAINQEVLSKVTGQYQNLEVINSGSVFELDERTLELIRSVCRDRNIWTIHFESHYLYRDKIPALREQFGEFDLKMKLGLETFDYDFREGVMRKGIAEKDPAVISQQFQEANFLFGIAGQSLESMRRDIVLGLQYFERICVNMMCENTTKIHPDKQVIEEFIRELYPQYKDNERVDILLNNTDFGVGD